MTNAIKSTKIGFRIKMEFRNVGFFVEVGKPVNEEKNPRSKDENQQKILQTNDAGSGVEPRPYWKDAIALTSAPYLLPDLITF